MQLDRLNATNNIELEELTNLNINIKYFERITEIIKLTFQKLRINPEGMSIYYQRYQNSTSVLAIKVSQGDDSDTQNYMFNGCSVEYYKNDLFCDVYLHAKAKSGKISSNIASLISKDIVEFFNNVEKDLLKNNLTNIELSLKIELSKNNKKDDKQKETKIKRLVKSIINKK